MLRKNLLAWIEGEREISLIPPVDTKSFVKPEVPVRRKKNADRPFFQKIHLRVIYRAVSVLLALGLSTVLILTVLGLPRIGSDTNPAENEVAKRYIESGVEETGAVNFVAGMILDYRAFDTFGESCVLFTAAACVFFLLRNDRGDEPTPPALPSDQILMGGVKLLVPAVMLLGVYVVLNGHLSPGGGFSGGAVMGAGLVLCMLAFGPEKVGRYFTAKTYRWITTVALVFYCLAKSYVFFTGANGLESGIPLGTPGSIFSSGLILPLNICVGAIVACTVYAFCVMFRKGNF